MAPLAPPLTRPLVLSKAKHCQAVLSKAKHWHAVMSEVPFKTSLLLNLFYKKGLKKSKKKKDRVIASTKVRGFVSGRIMRPPCGWRSKNMFDTKVQKDSTKKMIHVTYSSANRFHKKHEYQYYTWKKLCLDLDFFFYTW